jgi:hypothetical protein
MQYPPIKVTGPFTRETRVGRFRREASTYYRATRQGVYAEGHSPSDAAGRARDEIARRLGRVLGIEPRDARTLVDEWIVTVRE